MPVSTGPVGLANVRRCRLVVSAISFSENSGGPRGIDDIEDVILAILPGRDINRSELMVMTPSAF